MYFEALGPKDNRVQITEDMTRLPETTSSIWVSIDPNFVLFRGDVGGRLQNLDERTIIRLLRNSNKVRDVHVGSVGDELSPERVELLEVTITKAKRLHISRWQSGLAYSCLTSCLSQPNGLKGLYILSDLRQISIDQVQLLFEGVASSSCLRVLSMQKPSSVPDDEEAENYESFCNAFLNALQRNRSLKSLNFDVGSLFFTDDSETFSRIFKTAILGTKIEKLRIFSKDGRGQFNNFPRNLLIETLCNDECKLKELALWNCALVGVSNDDVDQMSNDACNKSLETLTIKAENLDLQMVVEVVARRFRSLVSLDMTGCDVGPRLALLDPLLIGTEQQRLSLRRLKLYRNGITEDQAIAFFRKLPQMTCIREIYLSASHLFVSSEAWVPVLVDAIQRNKSVESLHLNRLKHVSPMSKELLFRACSKMDDALRRNQERRLTEDFLNLVRSEVLPEKLWPLVLERAQKPISLNLFKTYTGDWVKQPSESVMQKDLLNRLLKEKMLQDHLH